MGDVWCALDLELDETVALKRLRDQPSAGGRMAELFRREVRLARRISHRNVARVFELLVIKGAESTQLALTMEYVQGHTLAELLKGGQPFEPASVVRVLRDTCAGLSAVHEAGVVHRDIKPGNVMLGEADRVVLMDFGVALAARDALAERGMLAGTPAYMAPELYAGAEASVASDVYALGCLAYELLTGQRAFDGTNRGSRRSSRRASIRRRRRASQTWPSSRARLPAWARRQRRCCGGWLWRRRPRSRQRRRRCSRRRSSPSSESGRSSRSCPWAGAGRAARRRFHRRAVAAQVAAGAGDRVGQAHAERAGAGAAGVGRRRLRARGERGRRRRGERGGAGRRGGVAGDLRTEGAHALALAGGGVDRRAAALDGGGSAEPAALGAPRRLRRAGVIELR